MIDTKGVGLLSAEDLVRGFARLKGAARSVDLMAMIHAFDVQLQKMMDALFQLGHVVDVSQPRSGSEGRVHISSYSEINNASKDLHALSATVASNASSRAVDDDPACSMKGPS